MIMFLLVLLIDTGFAITITTAGAPVTTLLPQKVFKSPSSDVFDNIHALVEDHQDTSNLTTDERWRVWLMTK